MRRSAAHKSVRARPPIDPRQIDQDLAQLKQITDCVRTIRLTTASPDPGNRQTSWHEGDAGALAVQPSRPEPQAGRDTIALAKRFPDVIQAIIVGNEVLLRGEMSAPDLARTIREVKAQVPMPVTYADVWSSGCVTARSPRRWTSSPFISCLLGGHSDPGIGGAPHVDAIRKQIVAAFPGKEVFVGNSDGRARPHARGAAVARQPARSCKRLALAKREATASI